MKTNHLFTLICAATISLYLGTASAQQETSSTTETTLPTEPAPMPPPAPQVTITETKIGDGAIAGDGQKIFVHYTGWLYDANQRNFHGKKFDSSLDRGKPISFVLGAHRVIPGWEQGLAGMKVGGRRTLIVPAESGYGARGVAGLIPPNAMLVFDVELMGVNPPL